jgi:hypothetical protein
MVQTLDPNLGDMVWTLEPDPSDMVQTLEPNLVLSQSPER